ncbi:MAG: hypothetical protein AB1603_06220, partial [Chloroflexota bacterium]
MDALFGCLGIAAFIVGYAFLLHGVVRRHRFQLRSFRRRLYVAGALIAVGTAGMVAGWALSAGLITLPSIVAGPQTSVVAPPLTAGPTTP